MNKKYILDYYKKYTGNNFSNENAISFTNMLMKKANFALQTGDKIFAYDGLKTGKELEQMYCLAEDIFTDKPELRGKEVKK